MALTAKVGFTEGTTAAAHRQEPTRAGEVTRSLGRHQCCLYALIYLYQYPEGTPIICPICMYIYIYIHICRYTLNHINILIYRPICIMCWTCTRRRNGQQKACNPNGWNRQFPSRASLPPGWRCLLVVKAWKSYENREELWRGKKTQREYPPKRDLYMIQIISYIHIYIYLCVCVLDLQVVPSMYSIWKFQINPRLQAYPCSHLSKKLGIPFWPPETS